MTAEDRYTALAARAVGEAMPGPAIDAIRDDETRVAGELDGIVALLRGAEVPASRGRRAAVSARIARRRLTITFRRFATAAAHFTRPMAWISSTGRVRPEMGKFSTARCVWAP